jgi:hypothetical protein
MWLMSDSEALAFISLSADGGAGDGGFANPSRAEHAAVIRALNAACGGICFCAAERRKWYLSQRNRRQTL